MKYICPNVLLITAVVRLCLCLSFCLSLSLTHTCGHFWPFRGNKKGIYIFYHHHHHHVVPSAQISLTLSRHLSLSFIASGRILRATLRIVTELLYVGSSWSPCFRSAMWRGPKEYITYELVPNSLSFCGYTIHV